MTKTTPKKRQERKENAAPQKENNPASKKTQFVCKNIVTKKKNPQQKLEKYFPVTRPKAPRVEKNFQGFPSVECRYETEVEKHVYRPPSYYKNWNDQEEPPLCVDCLLRPCVVKGKWNEIMEFWEDVMISEDDSDAMYFKMTNHSESILAEIFGDRFVRNNPAPLCVQDLVGRYIQEGTKEEEEEEEEKDERDDDLVAGAMDGNSFCTQED